MLHRSMKNGFRLSQILRHAHIQQVVSLPYKIAFYNLLKTVYRDTDVCGIDIASIK